MNKNFITLCRILLVALLVTLVACPSSETPKQPEGKAASILKSIEKRDIDTLYKLKDGTLTDKNILLIAPGGPMFDEVEIESGGPEEKAIIYSAPYDANQSPSVPSPRTKYATIILLNASEFSVAIHLRKKSI